MLLRRAFTRKAAISVGLQELQLRKLSLSSKMGLSDAAGVGSYETLSVSRPRENVVHVEMNRPEKMNAMNVAFWREMNQCFTSLANDKDCRAVVLTGAGKHFTAGLDLIDFQSLLFSNEIEDTGRKGFRIRKLISDMQESFNAVEKCPKPVIAAVHSACIGGGLDLISACDIRLCSKDAWFQIKEVDIGVLADVGTLQRLPKIVGNDSLVRELAYTARVFHSDEARGFGLVSRVLADRQTCVDAALQMAADIASKSPVAVQGTKVNIVFSRDHTVAESLDYASVWNSFAIQSEDTLKAGQAFLTKTKPTFSKL